MLELKNIVKNYLSGENTVHALKGVSVKFRKSEFVSILGPSGCGKTTMLNIVGGLDKYDAGDLMIHGRSTRDFNDRDWDAYRNHSIGFVFQSYNLIPHQSVLRNVELALTLSGVSKSERRKRAIKALEDVGLGDQLKKKPSEMSGGQMQRVSIARALVNDPDIILADEPTGALDTETGIMVMELLKKIANDRLVVMVTHNPELAQQYSTRIIRMLDGNILSDSMPLTDAEVESEKELDKKKCEADKKRKLPAMSMATSFSLSLKNLITKKGRTMLTAFAGSIGIIGIALIYAVSSGMTSYIDDVQEDTLASYPLTLESTHIDMSTLLQTFMGSKSSGEAHENDAVYQKGILYDMINALSSLDAKENDLTAFKAYLEEQLSDPESELSSALSGVGYSYDINLNVYTKNVDGQIIVSDTEALLQDLLIEYFGMDISSMTSMSESSSLSSVSSMAAMTSSSQLWQEMLPGSNGKLVSPLLEKQYDLVYGSWPNSYDEIVIVLDSRNEIDDMTLYALGLKSKSEIDELANAALTQNGVELEKQKWSYEEICDTDFRVVLECNAYTYDEASGIWRDLRETDTGLKYLYDNALKLKVSGIVRPSEDAVSTMLSSGIGYTSKLTEYVIENSHDSAAVKAQLANPDTDVFTGLPFDETTGTLGDAEKADVFKNYVASLDERAKAEAYVKMMSIPSEEQVAAQTELIVSGKTAEDIVAEMLPNISAQTGMSQTELESYLSSMSEEDIVGMYYSAVYEQVYAAMAEQAAAQLATMPAAQLLAGLDNEMNTADTSKLANYYDKVLVFSQSSLESNLSQLGYISLDTPSSISLYASTFENKDVIEDIIAAYNDNVDELEKIGYTDYVGIMMSSVTTIINAISYVLIAFVAISLIVSSIMIGVITLISVQERTKEIGILRALGASKKNVSRMFNAETVIIGFASGVIGVGVTYLLCIPINQILHKLTGIANLSAHLPIETALVLILISVMLTLIAGVIPSRSAAKKDPVIALRTE